MTFAIAKAKLDLDLLKLIPTAEQMKWVNCHDASPPTALVIGHHSGTPILASLLAMTGLQKSPLLQFTLGEKKLTQENVIRKDLVEPFKYFNTSALSPKETRIMSLFIKFYFYEARLVKEGLGGGGAHMGKLFPLNNLFCRTIAQSRPFH